jgi:hypothetical protein
MTHEEMNLLQEFLTQLEKIGHVDKDPAAAGLIAKTASNQPDALYLTIQKALLQNMALGSAQRRIEELQQQLAQARQTATAKSRFLGNDPWATPPSMPQNFGTQAIPSAIPSSPGPGQFMGSTSSFLGSMAQTAAGVAAGAFLFHGISNLLSEQHMNHDQNHEFLHTNHQNTADTMDDHQPDDVVEAYDHQVDTAYPDYDDGPESIDV